jgi:hypothetical protein
VHGQTGQRGEQSAGPGPPVATGHPAAADVTPGGEAHGERGRRGGEDGEHQQRQPAVLGERRRTPRQPERSEPRQPGQRRHAVGDHAGQQAAEEDGDGQTGRRAAVTEQLSCQHAQCRADHAGAGQPGAEERRSLHQCPGEDQTEPAGDTDERTGGQHDDEIAGRQGTQRQPPAQQQVPSPCLLIAPGQPGGGQRRPDPDQDGEHGAGPPDGEPAAGVQPDRRAEQGADRRVLGQRGQRLRVEGAVQPPVLHRDQGGHAAADDGDDRGAAAGLADGGRGHRPARGWKRGRRTCGRRCAIRRGPAGHAGTSP